MSTNNINSIYSIINDSKIETDQVPQMPDRILDIYKEHANDWDKPENTDFCFRSKVVDLNKFNKVLEKAKNYNIFHKVMSLTLLAVSVAILATAVILACVINPGFLLILVGGVITGMTALLIDVSAYNPELEIDGPLAPFPCLFESIYVYDAFKGVNRLEKQMNTKIKDLDNRSEPLRILLKNKDTIKQSIKTKFENINITNIEEEFDLGQVNELRWALKELNKAEVLLDYVDDGTLA